MTETLDPMYPPTREEVDMYQKCTKSHSCSDFQIERMSRVRTTAGDLMLYVMRNCPASREKSLAMTKIDEAIMFANASIARE